MTSRGVGDGEDSRLGEVLAVKIVDEVGYEVAVDKYRIIVESCAVCIVVLKLDLLVCDELHGWVYK